MTAAQRLTFLAIGVVIAIVAVIVLLALGAGGDDGAEIAATPTATTTPRAGAKAPAATATPRPRPPLIVQGSPRRLRFTEGELIRFRVRAKQDDEVHVHGYDKLEQVKAGQTVTFAFPASITGIFEVELENAGLQLGTLRVDPR